MNQSRLNLGLGLILVFFLINAAIIIIRHNIVPPPPVTNTTIYRAQQFKPETTLSYIYVIEVHDDGHTKEYCIDKDDILVIHQ